MTYGNNNVKEVKKMISRKEIEEIIEQYQEYLFAYCVSRLKNKYDADDVISEVFYALWTKKDRLETKNIKLWLFRCADISIKDFFRAKQKYEARNTYIDDIDEYDLPNIQDNEYITDYIERIDEKIWEQIKSQLPTDQLLLFQYRYIDNLTLYEISEKMNSPYPTIVHRCQKLKENIQTIAGKIYKT